MVEVDVKEAFKLPDGDHTGTIIKIGEREAKGYKFIDILIEMPDLHQIKVDYINNVTPLSNLGKLIQRFGTTLQIGTRISLEGIFVGKQCAFKSVADGQYAKIVGDSLVPAVRTETITNPETNPVQG